MDTYIIPTEVTVSLAFADVEIIRFYKLNTYSLFYVNYVNKVIKNKCMKFTFTNNQINMNQKITMRFFPISCT